MRDAADLLPHRAPDSMSAALLLHAIRRMAVGGLNDAHAANALIGAFGLGFRRPLVLLRAFMLESSRVSGRRLLLAPCCCHRTTADEAALLAAITAADATPAHAHSALAKLFGVSHCLGALASAQALAVAFADLGRRLDPD